MTDREKCILLYTGGGAVGAGGIGTGVALSKRDARISILPGSYRLA